MTEGVEPVTGLGGAQRADWYSPSKGVLHYSIDLPPRVAHRPGRGLSSVPANTRRSPNVVLMSGQRRRWWPNIKTTLGERLVFAGLAICCHTYRR